MTRQQRIDEFKQATAKELAEMLLESVDALLGPIIKSEKNTTSKTSLAKAFNQAVGEYANELREGSIVLPSNKISNYVIECLMDRTKRIYKGVNPYTERLGSMCSVLKVDINKFCTQKEEELKHMEHNPWDKLMELLAVVTHKHSEQKARS